MAFIRPGSAPNVSRRENEYASVFASLRNFAVILVAAEKIAEFSAKGWWGKRTIDALFQDNVRTHPERMAVIDAPNRTDFMDGPPRRLSYAALGLEVDRFAALLLSLGLVKDDVVGMQLPNCVEQYVVYLACARLGIVVTPFPAPYREHELEYLLAHTQARAVVTCGRIGRHAHAAMMQGMMAGLPDLCMVLAWGEGLPAGVESLDLLLDKPHDSAAVDTYLRDTVVSANDVFTICWTSGTEARPKGVPRSHNEWLVTGPSVIEAAGLKPGCRLLNPFPLVNMAGLSTCFAAWTLLAGTVVQHQPFTLPVFLQQIRDEAIDYTVAAPAILNMLLQNETLLEGIDFKRLHSIGSGSAPLSEWMVRGYHDRYGVEIVNYFGSNEGAALSGSPFDIPDPGERARYFPRYGVPGFKWTISTSRKVTTRLVDLETGDDIEEAGRPGELRFRGATIFSGYYRDAELTVRAFDEHGFYRSGDLFEIAGDALQWYRYVGRSKDIVIRGGMNISSEEIESMLLACPNVQEVAVVGYPDDVLGERVCACIVARPGSTLTLADIVGYLKNEQKVAAYKLPEAILLVDALPRNPVGKVLKRVLRDRLAAATATSV